MATNLYYINWASRVQTRALLMRRVFKSWYLRQAELKPKNVWLECYSTLSHGTSQVTRHLISLHSVNEIIIVSNMNKNRNARLNKCSLFTWIRLRIENWVIGIKFAEGLRTPKRTLIQTLHIHLHFYIQIWRIIIIRIILNDFSIKPVVPHHKCFSNDSLFCVFSLQFSDQNF